jgi:capsular exopolysaccharide synthesis family protein
MSAPEPFGEFGPRRHGGTARDYLQVLRRRKWIVLQALILVPAAAIALSLRQSAQYEAQAQVLLTHQSFAALLTNTQDPNANQQFSDRIAATQADLARVPTVVISALKSVPRANLTATEFLRSSSVNSAANVDILTFSVTARTPPLAIQLATAYAQAYTSYRHQLDTASLQRARNDVGMRIAQLRANDQGRSALATRLVETEQQLQTLETLQTSNATVVKPASRAPQVSPQPVRNGILGVLFGLVIGLGLAFLIDAFDTRVRSGEEIAERLGIALLGRLPEPPKRVRERQGLVMFEEPNGQHAEAFRMLRTNLELANIDQEAKVIAVASALPSEGKSTTIANLAIAIARGGHRVALVDLDLRRPMLGTFFRADIPTGIVEVALGHVSLDQALLHINVATFLESADVISDAHPELDVLVAGRTAPNPGEFVSSRRLANILAELRERYDFVLVDTPPLLSVGDGLALSAHLDAFMLVSNLSLTRRGELHELRRTLGFARCQVLGTVLTASSATATYGYVGPYEGYGEPARETPVLLARSKPGTD